MHQKVWHDARDLYLLCLLDVVLNRIPEKVSELSAKSEKDFTAWLSNQSFEHRKEYTISLKRPFQECTAKERSKNDGTLTGMASIMEEFGKE